MYAEADLIRKKSEPLNIAIESAMPGKIGVADFFILSGEKMIVACANCPPKEERKIGKKSKKTGKTKTF